jgi:hypothetical protein
VNLRLRITLLILALLVVGIVTVVGHSIDTAREEISSEVESTRTLVTQLLYIVNNPQDGTGSESLNQDFIEQLASDQRASFRCGYSRTWRPRCFDG